MNPGNQPQKVFNRTPPIKGSFPLDHDGECKQFMAVYMSCLKRNKSAYQMCISESKAYLQCRMDRDLMAPENFKRLGFEGSTESEENN